MKKVLFLFLSLPFSLSSRDACVNDNFTKPLSNYKHSIEAYKTNLDLLYKIEINNTQKSIANVIKKIKICESAYENIQEALFIVRFLPNCRPDTLDNLNKIQNDLLAQKQNYMLKYEKFLKKTINLTAHSYLSFFGNKLNSSSIIQKNNTDRHKLNNFVTAFNADILAYART